MEISVWGENEYGMCTFKGKPRKGSQESSVEQRELGSQDEVLIGGLSCPNPQGFSKVKAQFKDLLRLEQQTEPLHLHID
jgi:hypothetical protein